ncbi:unnamed protein product [Aphanomyces euteiches]
MAVYFACDRWVSVPAMASNENRGCVAIQTAANQHKHLDFVFDMEAADGVNWTAVKRLQGVVGIAADTIES